MGKSLNKVIGMGEYRICIERDRNGFEVTVTDPKVVEANQASRKSDTYDWKDPNVEYNFTTKEQALAFVEKIIDSALPEDEYSAAFDKAAKEAQNG